MRAYGSKINIVSQFVINWPPKQSNQRRRLVGINDMDSTKALERFDMNSNFANALFHVVCGTSCSLPFLDRPGEKGSVAFHIIFVGRCRGLRKLSSFGFLSCASCASKADEHASCSMCVIIASSGGGEKYGWDTTYTCWPIFETSSFLSQSFCCNNEGRTRGRFRKGRKEGNSKCALSHSYLQHAIRLRCIRFFRVSFCIRYWVSTPKTDPQASSLPTFL